ncbi:hypothetical protein B0H14DRAFT_2946470 [Mycena olivaceomarginata]|nr:hypothetical protein B0H14DRAFT_2946470 [Mycena olivaceomarginata]
MEVEIDANDTVKRLKLYPVTSATCSAAYSSSANVSGLKLSRLYKRRRRLWADDIWALFASVALVIQVVAIFLHIPPPNSLSYTTRIAGAARQLLIPLLG